MAWLRRRRGIHGAAPSAWSEENAADIFAYELIAQRQMEQDAMLWQTPSLAITGQAFLLTLAFTETVPFVGKIAVALLGTFIAIMSLQLMSKHRYLAQVDAQEMQRLQKVLGLPLIAQRRWDVTSASFNSRDAPTRRFWNSRRSYPIWVVGMWLFVVVNVVAIVLAGRPEGA